MKELLHKLRVMENEMKEAESKSYYWLDEKHFDEAKSVEYERKANEIYERLYKVFDQAADKIVNITAGQIDKAMAMKMIRCRRDDVERIFA